jgi:hypothetical protein
MCCNTPARGEPVAENKNAVRVESAAVRLRNAVCARCRGECLDNVVIPRAHQGSQHEMQYFVHRSRPPGCGSTLPAPPKGPMHPVAIHAGCREVLESCYA